MNNIIQFPLERVRKSKKDLLIDEFASISEEMVEIAQYIFEIIEFELEELDLVYYESVDLREDADMFVITNLLYSMLARHQGIPHNLQSDLDAIYDKLNYIMEPETE